MSPRLCLLALIIVLFSGAAATLRAAPVEVIPAELHGAIQPQVAMSPSGKIHVVFGKDASIYHTTSADGARTFSKPVQVGSVPKLALGMRRGPRITATENLVTVTAQGDGDLHAWTSADNGATWAAVANLNDKPKSAREGFHAIAGDGKGMVAAVWLDGRNGGAEVWSTVSHDGGATWSPNVQVYKSPDGHVCECCNPSVAIDPQGKIAVMFRNWLGGSRDMYLATSSDGGKAFTPAEKLGTGTWKLNGCPMDGGGIAFAAPGKAVTAWRRENAIFSTDGKAAEQRVAGGMQPIAVTGKFGTAYLWEQGRGLMLKKGMSSPSRFANGASFASTAVAPGQDPVIVWEGGDRSIFADVLH